MANWAPGVPCTLLELPTIRWGPTDAVGNAGMDGNGMMMVEIIEDTDRIIPPFPGSSKFGTFVGDIWMLIFFIW